MAGGCRRAAGERRAGACRPARALPL